MVIGLIEMEMQILLLILTRYLREYETPQLNQPYWEIFKMTNNNILLYSTHKTGKPVVHKTT